MPVKTIKAISALLLCASISFAAETPHYQFQKVPQGSTNYPALMDGFMDDVDAAIWGRQQENVQQDTNIDDRLVIDGTAPGTPTCIAPTTGVDIDQSGNAFTWINVSWSGVTDTDLRQYEIRGKKGVSGEYFYSYTNQVSVIFAPAMAGESYYFTVRAIDKQGNVGTYCTEQAIVADKDLSAPATPSGLGLTTGLDQDNNGVTYVWVQADWTANTEKDVVSYKLRIKESVGGSYYYATTTANTLRVVGLKQGVTYYVGVKAIDASKNESAYTTDVSLASAADTTPPAAPTSPAATSSFKAIWLTWTNPVDDDLDSIEVWRSATNDSATASKVGESPGITYSDGNLGVGQTFYYWLKSRDWSGNSSGLSPPQYSGISATTGSIGTTDITGFAINASKIYTKIPVLESDSWANNSPSGGYVSWGTHTLYYDGVAYAIAAGNTNLKYIYWSGLSASYAGAATINDGVGPTLNDNEFIIATNVSGVHDLAWNAIANQVIGSAFIQDAAIVNAKIANLAVDNAKISDLSATKINAGSLQSLNWSGTVGSQFNISDGTFYIGGSTNPKLSWNGTTLTVKGSVSVESGQTFSCTDCVSGTAVNFNYATSGSEGGNASNTDNVGSQAASSVNTGVSRATTGLNSSGQTTQLVDTTNMPAISSGASKVVIGNEGIKMFNASSAERVSINTDGTFRFGNSAGDNLYWNGSTLVLTGRATIATSADSATNATNATNAGYATSAGSATTATNATNAGYATSAGSATTATTASSANDLSCTDCVAGTEVAFNYAGSSSEGGNANNSNDLSCTDCVADTELNNTIDLGAGGVTIRSNNANNKVQLSSAGIYGYNTSGTQTFGIDSSNGNAYFGPTGNQISWDGSTLTVPAAKVTGTLSAATISANNIAAGTITGSTLQTAASGKRFVVSTSDNQAHFYGDRGDGTIEDLASIGINAVGGDSIVGYFGSANSLKMGVYGQTTSSIGVRGSATTGTGIYATSTSGKGIFSSVGVGGIAGVFKSTETQKIRLTNQNENDDMVEFGMGEHSTYAWPYVRHYYQSYANDKNGTWFPIAYGKIVTWTGNGVNPRTVTCGFQPNYIQIIKTTGGAAGDQMWIDGMATNTVKDGTNGTLYTDRLVSIDSAGFTVTAHTAVNVSGQPYSALCYKMKIN